MVILKKLTFAPFFLLSFGYLCYLLPAFISSSLLIFSLDLDTLILTTLIPVLCLITGLFFVLFVTLSQDWRLVLPVIFIAILPSFVFLPNPFSIYLAIGAFLSLLLIFAILNKKLKTYLTFQPAFLLSSLIRNLAVLLALVISLIFYLDTADRIRQNGFEIPDALINQAQQLNSQNTDTDSATFQLTTEQKQIIDQAKRNPDILKGSGYTLSDLETLEQAVTGNNSPSVSEAVKETIKKQVETMIKPYQGFIAPVLGLIVLTSFFSTISLLGLLVPLFLWLIFWILKATGFVKFTTEMREVKKLVV